MAVFLWSPCGTEVCTWGLGSNRVEGGVGDGARGSGHHSVRFCRVRGSARGGVCYELTNRSHLCPHCTPKASSTRVPSSPPRPSPRAASLSTCSPCQCFHRPSSLRAVGEASAPHWGAARLHSPVSRPPASCASSTRLPEAKGRPAPGNPSSGRGGRPAPPPHAPGPTLMSLASPKSPTLQMLLAPTRMFLAARSR